MRRRVVSAIGGLGVLAGALTGCSSSADDNAAAAAIRSDGVGGSEMEEPTPLAMPHRAVTLTAMDVRTTLDEKLVTDLDLGSGELDAASGHEFVAVSFIIDEPTYADDGGEARVAVVTEDDEHDVTETFNERPVDGDEVALVVSVPVDSPVSLEITDEGKTASLDLRTGQRSEQTMSDATGAYYPVWASDIDGQLESTAIAAPTNSASYPDWVSIDLSLSQSRVSANGWIPGIGWAPDDQSFLVVSDVIAKLRLAAGLCGVTWDPATSVTFTPTGGTPTPAVGFSAGEYFTRADFAFAVPRGTAEGTLTLAPKATITGDCQLAQPFPTAQLTITG